MGLRLSNNEEFQFYKNFDGIPITTHPEDEVEFHPRKKSKQNVYQ